MTMAARLWKGLKAGLGLANRHKIKVGEDAMGNTYWEVVRHSGPQRLNGRIMVTRSGEEAVYAPDDMPPAWASWLRGTTNTPPTEEQVNQEEARIHIMARRVADIEARDNANRLASGKIEPIAATSVSMKGIFENHAALRQFSSPTSRSTPSTGAGGVFRPGEWMPQQGGLQDDTTLDTPSVLARDAVDKSGDDERPEETAWQPGA
eukprot:m.661011 g.661011  ORF g.661011 m.661011 type:complete len:206 (+) comp22733_c0_seq9:223-840(+)